MTGFGVMCKPEGGERKEVCREMEENRADLWRERWRHEWVVSVSPDSCIVSLNLTSCNC